MTRDALHDRTVRDLPSLLQAGDLLVFNDTKVIPARLLGTRPSGGKVEALLIRQQGGGRWLAFARPAKRLKVGDALDLRRGLDGRVAGEARRRLDRDRLRPRRRGADGGHRDAPARCRCRPISAAARPMRATAPTTRRCSPEVDGSVAAPTAGLHFTPELMAALDARRRPHGQRHAACRRRHLPAGAGRRHRQHTMHAEWGEVPQATADAIAAAQARRLHRHDRAAPARDWWRATGRCAPGPARPTSSSRRAIASASSTCC